ncbi:unnamed protein product [Owenia fusiformis]|uniref:Transcriptional adapter n=1 Tax=Owenia fusiformis TaxID=6347 RepID=A0A8J1YC79_OWEFU|nr:unnamed protein product [Owenia fusiformis]
MESPSCLGCCIMLQDPYIKCIDCQKETFLCTHCFADGLEKDGHQNNHGYSVIRYDFPIFENGWSANEEMKLLDGIQDCGLSNWDDVSKMVQTKTKSQCETHYLKYYISNIKKQMPDLPLPEVSYYPSPVMFKISEDPPRPPQGSSMQTDMAGYMSARGDFTVEYANYAEHDLRDISFDDTEEDPLIDEVKLAVLDVYQNCLRDRQRKKKVIRDYGLISIKKHLATYRRYEKTGNMYPCLESLQVFTRMLPPIEFDMYTEALLLQAELKEEVQHLQECRRNGVVKKRAARVFKTLRQRREKLKTSRTSLDDVLVHLQDEVACQQWLHRQATLDLATRGANIILPAAPRRTAPPLDIMGMPGYEKLNQKEREVCANVRLVPESFLDFKAILMNEYKKIGYLKLAQARNLIKIDVNKTRKIYDYLLDESLISTTPTAL